MVKAELRYEVIEQLREIVVEHSLTDEWDQIMIEAQPCFDVVDLQTDFLPQIGATKVGGLPDLPPNCAWPSKGDERFTFLAQVNLAELSEPSLDNMPESGWLWFFLGSDESALDVDHQVLFFDGPITSLHRTSPPPMRETNKESRGFNSAAAVFSPSFSLPFETELSQRIFGRSEKAFSVLYHEATRVGGHPEQYNGDYRHDAVLVWNGFKDVVYDCRKSDEQIQNEIKEWSNRGMDYLAKNLAALKPRIEDYRKQKPTLDDQVNRCRHLFQLTSLQELEMCWWDAGCLQFFIDEDLLKTRRFDRTYCGLMSS